MITLIVGQNAVGKSAYLKERVKAEAAGRNDILSNLFENQFLEHIPYEKERIDELKELLDTQDVVENQGILGIHTEELNISKSFAELVTLMCRKGKVLFLDEPEYGLEYKEIGFLVAFLSRIESTFETIEIVTHSEIMLGLINKKVKTVAFNYDKGKYEITDLTRTEYETID